MAEGAKVFFPSGGNAQVYQNNQLNTQFFGEQYDGTHDNCLNALNIVTYCEKNKDTTQKVFVFGSFFCE